MREDTEAYRAACRLLDAIHPGLTKLPTTTGVITQIDHVLFAPKEGSAKAAIDDIRADLRAIDEGRQ